MSETTSPSTYADQFVDWLVADGYTHCFFLAGGNIMHLLNSVRSRLKCIPVVNEVAAGIAVEYFNAIADKKQGKAFALVTAGPGVTNIITAMAGAYLESRELLVVAGQVKAADLANGQVRQRGIQEVDGCALVSPITKAVLQIQAPVPREQVSALVGIGREPRQGPVFIEFCLDAQAAQPVADEADSAVMSQVFGEPGPPDLSDLRNWIDNSARPVLLLGGGVSRDLATRLLPQLEEFGMPVMTSWNALDRISFDNPLFLGRPDTWGMRAANLLIQQADLLISVGARLSLQQTGFAWDEFAPLARVVQIDVDQAELDKHHPRKDLIMRARAEEFLPWLVEQSGSTRWTQWRGFGKDVLRRLPLNEPENITGEGFISPYVFSDHLSDFLTEADVIVPCSSGGASTVLMQSFRQKQGQKVMNDKALASMGYGLSGAIGAALGNPQRRTVLVEGDGGFAQNLQELGTVRAQNLNLKMFIFRNEGYASIRMTQRNYFDGAWIGCDNTTGLGLPNWAILAQAFGIPHLDLEPHEAFENRAIRREMEARGPLLVTVPIDPEQTYFPKITSRITPDGSMKSNPLHHMSPDLRPDIFGSVAPYLSVHEGDFT